VLLRARIENKRYDQQKGASALQRANYYDGHAPNNLKRQLRSKKNSLRSKKCDRNALREIDEQIIIYHQHYEHTYNMCIYVERRYSDVSM